MAHFVTHIIWISAPLYFHQSCCATEDGQEMDGLGGGAKKGKRLSYETCLI